MSVATSDRRAEEHVPTPIDVYLRRQADLTAVERFAARTPADHTRPEGARWWEDRLPAAPPGPGQQYGFRVDLDACTGCKACVSACHSLNGLADGETWRSVGTLRGGDAVAATTQASVRTVTAACHHCVEPACLVGCPANAYEKDPITGIVRHLDDSCIGCSYCTLTCPYEVPRMQPDLGIVRKCDMCADRLGEGEAPACVQGCPTGAITIDVVDVADLRAEGRQDAAALVPGAPASAMTVPSTRYVSAAPLPDGLVADDHASVRPAAGHTPLAVMLVLTQVSVGAFAVGAVDTVVARDGGGPARTAAALVALGTGLLALAASVLHLGRPRLAWRALLGLRHSWLSREILAFSAFSALAAAWSLALVADLDTALQVPLAVAAGVTGVAGVGCSTAIYASTGRRWWSWPLTTLRFAATTVAGGTLLAAATVVLTGVGDPGDTVVHRIVPLLVVGALATAASVVAPLVPVLRPTSTTERRTRQLLTGRLRGILVTRAALAATALVGAAVAVGTLAASPSAGIGAGVVLATSLVVLVVGELLERRLFFLASVAPRMPGMAR